VFTNKEREDLFVLFPSMSLKHLRPQSRTVNPHVLTLWYTQNRNKCIWFELWPYYYQWNAPSIKRKNTHRASSGIAIYSVRWRPLLCVFDVSVKSI